MSGSENKRVLSGAQASGLLHIGNYHGALENWVKLQEDFECFYFIANWHALTTLLNEPGKIQHFAWEVALDFLACGLDPDRSTLFLQSDVIQHAELALLLGMATPVPWLERVPTYKDKKQELQNKDMSGFGFLGYPVIQAADITMYRADFVPVGEDQLPHLELTREIVRRINYIYGPVLVEPKDLITKSASVPGLDGRKMSKSYDNAIYLSDDDETVKKKLMNTVTDPQRQRRKDPGRPEVCNIFSYHRLYSEAERIGEIDQLCRSAGIGCVECKKELIERFFDFFAGMRKKRRELEKNPAYVKEVFSLGAEKARAAAEDTMSVVRKAMRLGWDS